MNAPDPTPLPFQSTEYFRFVLLRPDRAAIEADWIVRALLHPEAEREQGDGRFRRWVYILEVQRFLRVVVLPDGKTVHNAFFDRGFRR